MKLAVIPARGGSKRVPHKNIKLFSGKPMMIWSIEAALSSQLFDHIIVSTDDEMIADIATKAGVLAPFVRPASLSDDFTPTVPVISHALTWAERNIGEFSSVCCIYATAPFIQVSDLISGQNLLEHSDADYVFPVTRYAFPVQRAITLNSNGRAEMLFPEHALTRSQDLQETYHDAGQFYWGRRDAWANGITVMGPNSAPFVIDRQRVQDIDTEEDWKLAEITHRVIEESNSITPACNVKTG